MTIRDSVDKQKEEVKIAANDDRRKQDALWRKSVDRKVSTVEKNQRSMLSILKKLSGRIEHIAEDTSTMRELTRCLRGAAKVMLWFANKISMVATAINKFVRPVIIALITMAVIFGVATAVFKHIKLPEWVLDLLHLLI
jgi:SpoVK/Ycf46/Vps4 family AAA+-type ATPase